MYKDCIVPISSLKKVISLDKYDFKTTKEITPLSDVIGQDRAVSSINFALEINDSGYNIFVTGRYGTGRTTIVTDLMQNAAKKKPIPSDHAFVYNFENPDEPTCLAIPCGKAV
jgi:DNA replication protein DnaC